MITRRQYPSWTSDEIDILKNNADLSASQLYPLLEHRSESAIKQRRTILGIGRGCAGKMFTSEEIEFLTANKNKPRKWVANQLGRGESSVSSFALRGGVYREWHCEICNSKLRQQGMYCSDHKYIGRQIRSYVYRIKKVGGDLKKEEIARLLSKDCAYCGGAATGIDRIDNALGYIKGNVASCCSKCNFMKSDMNKDDWLDQVEKIYKFIRRSK